MKVSMCVYITDKEKKALKLIADSKAVSQTQVMRSALSLYINWFNKPDPCPLCGTTKEKNNE